MKNAQYFHQSVGMLDLPVIYRPAPSRSRAAATHALICDNGLCIEALTFYFSVPGRHCI